MQTVTQNEGSAQQNPGPYRVQVLDRAVSILELLSNSPKEMSLGELTSAIGLHKSTVHRLLMVLQSHRLVEKSKLRGGYRIGTKLFELSTQANPNLRQDAIDAPPRASAATASES
jgi:DNA-binding IclR family transcriptional regulator